MTDVRLIESPVFPVERVNVESAREKKGGGRPDYWEMVFWWTRKPLAGARAVIAASILPSDVPPSEFLLMTRLTSGRSPAHRQNPSIPPRYRELFARKKLLDPFAGFGSIPLEAVRLGVGEVVAVELLPAAYIFLKAVLEIPKWAVDNKLERDLLSDLEKAGSWIVGELKKDSDLMELYDKDVAVYIGTWEVKCPHCGRYTPLIGNWWLARVTGREEEAEEEGEKKGSFKRLAWMEPVKSGEAIEIKIVDLNKELAKKEIQARVNTKQRIVEANGKTYKIPEPNIDAKGETATCLHCNNKIKSEKRGEWLVKTALKEWNKNIEEYLSGRIKIEDLKKSPARPRIIARVKTTEKDIEFQQATREDTEKLWKALEKLKQIWGDPDIPTEPMTPYGGPTLGDPPLIFKNFYKLFNPRQLLTHIKIVKLIREAGKRIEEEKLKQGWDKQKARRHAEAVTTYLAMALCKYADYNSLANRYRPDKIRFEATFAQRGIAMIWNHVDAYPLIRVTGMSGQWIKVFDDMISGLQYIFNAISSSSSRVSVVLDDATVLRRLSGGRFDLIVTDPPYRDDMPYTELSDFYYVWLKRALSDVIEEFGVKRLAPRFYPEAFFDDAGREISTQWQYFAARDISESEGRAKYLGVEGGSLAHFKRLLSESFRVMSSRLTDEGLLVTYYAHTTPEAWEALLEAGWLSAGMRVSAAYALVTESTERMTARGKTSLDVSIVVVWRRGVEGEALADDVYREAVEEASKIAETYIKAGYEDVNLFVVTLGRVLSCFTKYKRIIGVKRSDKSSGFVEDLVKNYVYPATAEAIARAYGARGGRLSSYSMFYLLAKTLVGRRAGQARRVLDRSTALILSLGTRATIKDLMRAKVLASKKKVLILMEPKWGSRELKTAVEEALIDRGLNPRYPVVSTAVDLLHLLEYYAVTMPREEFKSKADDFKSRYPAFYEEALALSEALARSLVQEDPEKELARRVAETLGAAPARGLDAFMGR